MPSHDSKLLERASESWQGGRALEAGRLIFASLPSALRPKWAARILRLVLGRSGVDTSLFENVLFTAEHRSLWGDGHRVFSTLRGSVLQLDEMERKHGLTDEEDLFHSILLLAELVAKVTYNATNPDDEFDEDSGWWIAACLRGFVDHWNDGAFSQEAWSALVSLES